MPRPPSYFKRVEASTRDIWKQLENPELFGPWNQLFKQIQSPKHVLSELLQNADDAGATRAKVDLHESRFAFSHNGQDFDHDQFRAICRFGVSNKRTIHTIGFRGIGFKSTFSLGPVVRLRTPTLGVHFNEKQFTLPVWNGAVTADGATCVEIEICDGEKFRAIEDNMQQWALSPYSLLFFHKINSVEFATHQVSKREIREGPVPDSSWVGLKTRDEEERKLLLIESASENFPKDAVTEIRAERNLSTDDEDIPPCSVQLVVGMPAAENRFFVILPTGHAPKVPFSVNAPFIQDPARYGIKELASSPTNRWLVFRAARLAAESFIKWIFSEDLSLAERAKAYDLVPERTSSWENDATKSRISVVFRERVEDFALLCADGSVCRARCARAVPRELFEVWPEETLRELFLEEGEKLLSPNISPKHLETLIRHEWTSKISPSQAFQKLADCSALPRPDGDKLEKLWQFVGENLSSLNVDPRSLPIVPIRGDEEWLYPASEVVRFSGESRALDPKDARFLGRHVRSLDFDWLQGQLNRLHGSPFLRNALTRMQNELGFSEATRIQDLVWRTARAMAGADEPLIEDLIRITHILAANGWDAPEDFSYVVRDGTILEAARFVSVAELLQCEDLLPDEWAETHCLHPSYFEPSPTISQQAFRDWCLSRKSRLHPFAPVDETRVSFSSRDAFLDAVRFLGGASPQSFPYKKHQYEIATPDFPEAVVDAIKSLPKEEQSTAWFRILRSLLLSGTFPQIRPTVTKQRGTSYAKTVDCGEMPPLWLHRFRSIKCLPDENGVLHVPSDLLLRTAETEALSGVEPFVAFELDGEKNRPFLEALGVRSSSSSFEGLLDRLKALRNHPQPLKILQDIQKQYIALDRISTRCGTEESAEIRRRLMHEPMVLTEAGTWAEGVSLSIHPADGREDEAETVHNLFRSLAIWGRVGMAQFPSLERTLKWVESLPSGEKLNREQAERLASQIAADPVRVWESTGHWLNLESQWVPVSSLKWSMDMSSMARTSELFPAVRSATADFRSLNQSTLQNSPFASLPGLRGAIERVAEPGHQPVRDRFPSAWIETFANCLARVSDSNIADNPATRRLFGTAVKEVHDLKMTPHLDGAPAGPTRPVDVLWIGEMLYLRSAPLVRNLKAVVAEIAAPFETAPGDRRVSEALLFAADRQASEIEEYFQENFDMQEDLTFDVRGDSSEAPPPDSRGGGDSPEASPGDTESRGSSEPDSSDSEDDAPESVPSSEAEPSGGSGTDDNSDEPEPDAGEATGPDTSPPGDEEQGRNGVSPSKELLSAFAEALHSEGYTFNARIDTFTHPSGRSIQRLNSPFKGWEEKNGNNELFRRFWLGRSDRDEAFEIPDTLWSGIQRDPEKHALFLFRGNGDHELVAGSDLVEKIELGKARLYPLSYRLRLSEQ